MTNLPQAKDVYDSEYQKRIAYGQSFNLAVAIVNPLMRAGKIKAEELEVRLGKWQEYFYSELTKPYTATSYNLGEVDHKKSKDVGREDGQISIEEII